MRFGDRLRINMSVPDHLASARVPSMLLQPVAENAFEHGIARRAQGGAICVAATAEGGKLTLSIYNDGPQLPPDSMRKGTGIGFSNSVERLRSLYGDRFDLSLRNRDAGVEVLIVLPLITG
jgi:LytS/YehU family sensor histidine kinase